MTTLTLPNGVRIDTDRTVWVHPDGGVTIDAAEVQPATTTEVAEGPTYSEADEPLITIEEADSLIAGYVRDQEAKGEEVSAFFHPWGNDHYEVVAFGSTDVSYGDHVEYQRVPLIDHVYVTRAVAEELGERYGIGIDE